MVIHGEKTYTTLEHLTLYAKKQNKKKGIPKLSEHIFISMLFAEKKTHTTDWVLMILGIK